MDDKFDCIIVGGGIAGLSAALTLAKNNMKFLLVERGEFSGAKNVSGGVLWGSRLADLVPDYWMQDAGFERYVRHRRLTFLDEQSAFSIDFKSDHFNEQPYKGLIVLRSKFDNWLAGKVEEAIAESSFPEDSFIAPNILVDKILMEGGRATGIKTGEEEFHANCVIIAEGVNNLLTRQVGLQSDYVPADYMATGVKEIIRFDQSVLEDRFQLDGNSGLTNEFIGYASDGIEGGGFLYTNKDTISIGLVLNLKSMRENMSQDKKIYDVLTHFKSHSAVKDMLRGGEVVEYSAHVVSTGDERALPKELYTDGVLLAGEAANLLLNSGKAIQGMDYAMESGILAAESVIEAKEKNDFSKTTLSSYRKKLDASYVMKDLRSFQSAVQFLHSEEMFTSVPKVVNEFGRSFFTVDNKPTAKTPAMLKDAVSKHSSLWNMIKLGIKGARSL
ncbi:MAG: FAD-dependent oxidoreductase [Bacteroidetes bacterium]|nr:FAD-dependent oxidoreductase [Bacteroidota bacterium]MCH8523360.1 FAD-dependent oxidoreductase [Balneolales bacterium]